MKIADEICNRNKGILNEREGSHKRLKIQATKMLQVSNKHFASLTKGTNILIKILRPRQVLTVVTEVNISGLFKLSNENGHRGSIIFNK